MNNKIWLVSLWTLALSPAWAQEPPPLPDFPAGQVFNPANPMYGGRQPIPQIEPLAPDTSDVGQEDMPSMPSISLDEFDFFNPGAELRDDMLTPEPEEATEPAAPEEVADESPAPASRRPLTHKQGYSKRFNYKRQHLPETIYRREYNGANRHLPLARSELDYDIATFHAVARNDLNAVRAMIEHGGRNLKMRNAEGRTLVEVASQYRAHAVMRYLLAKGAPAGGVFQTDRLGYYALQMGH